MDNLFPNEPLHDAATQRAQALSNNQATARPRPKFSDVETMSMPTSCSVVSVCRNVSRSRAVVDAKYADDASIHTAKSRRENARQGNWNGGRIPYGYETYVHERHGSKERKRLRICEAEARIVRLIFEWAALGLGGRAIVVKLK